MEYHFFAEPKQRNDRCPILNLLTYKETIFDSHSVSLLIDPQEVSLKIDMMITFPVKFCGVSPDLNSKCLIS